MKFLINKKYILMFVLLFPLIEPAFFQTFEIVHMLYNIGKIAVFLLLFLTYIIKRKFPSKVIILMGLMLGFMMLACKFGRGNINSTLNAYLPYLVIMMWLDLYMQQDLKGTLKVFVFLLDVYAILDFISLIVFPNGLYISRSYQATDYVCWFLGYKNPQVRFLLPYIALLLIRDNVFYKKTTKLSYIKIVFIIFITLKLKSTTGLIGAVLFLTLNFIFGSKKISKLKYYVLKVLNIKIIYILIAILAVLMIFFGIQNNFAFFIEDILHKDVDLTDRIYVWNTVIDVVKDKVVLGEGVMYAELSREVVGASHAHNYFLNTVYNGGIVSLVLLSIIWLITGKESNKYIDNYNVRIVVFMSIVFLVMGLTESLTATILLYPIIILAYNSKILSENEITINKGKKENV